MPAPILIYAEEAHEIAARLTPRFSEERFLPITAPDGLAAALSENPEIAFTIKSETLAPPGHAEIAAHASLRWIQVGGSGYEHLGDWPRARLSVTNCLGLLAPFLAESCLGAMLALNHNLIRYRDQQRARHWQGHGFRPLAGQTLLIVGAGAIGGELARRAAALGMRVIAIRRSDTPVEGAAETLPPEALQGALAEADIVSVHLRLTAETEGLFDAQMFARMKSGALFLNTARGGHVVEADLAAALASGRLRGAYLDVFAREPLPPDSPLWDEERLLISPHHSDAALDWVERFTDFFADNLARWRAGETLVNRAG
ncbi:MAG: D-2-hydroxyacid dehydrogenase [Pseudomonadota bacterium]